MSIFFLFLSLAWLGEVRATRLFVGGGGQRGGGLEVQLILHQDKCEFKLLWVWREREGGCRVGREEISSGKTGRGRRAGKKEVRMKGLPLTE